ncbi:DNA polymerase III subunit chi [Escherichia coli]
MRPSRGAWAIKIYLLCDDQAQALRLDELLWQLPPERFVPHQLQGESGMAPVEIGYQPPKRRYAPASINLATATPLFAGHFAQVVDFVPTDETQKQQARERYKHYRQAGHTLEIRGSARPCRTGSGAALTATN